MVGKMNYVMTKQVTRKSRKSSKVFNILLVTMSILFILMGIIFDRGMLFLSILSILMYWLNSFQSLRDYEYHMEDGRLTVDVIQGKRRRKRAQELELKNLEVIAPNWHEAVAKYRKNGGTEHLKKYDYTSYEDDIPYYTMIIHDGKRKIKVLMDFDEEWLLKIKQWYPEKVYLS